MTTHSRLRDLASKATQPGPWTVKSEPQGKGRRSYRVIDANGFWVADVDDAPHDAAFIAAASPDVVLALLDRLEAAEAKAAVIGGEACIEERARGNGPCGACAVCCNEARRQLAAARAEIEYLESDIDDLNQRIGGLT